MGLENEKPICLFQPGQGIDNICAIDCHHVRTGMSWNSLFFFKARTGELFSANTHASARGLAELGNNLFKSSGGLLRAETCKQLHANPKKATDAAIKGLILI